MRFFYTESYKAATLDDLVVKWRKGRWGKGKGKVGLEVVKEEEVAIGALCVNACRVAKEIYGGRAMEGV